MSNKNPSPTLYDAATYFRNAAHHGRMSYSTADAMRITLTNIFSTVYGDNWRNVALDGINEADVFHRFKMMTTKDYTPQTLKIYRTRLHRALEQFDNDSQQTDTDSTKAALDNAIHQLSTSIKIIQAIFLPNLEKKIFKPQAKEDYNLYAIPVASDVTVGLALPKGLSSQELDSAHKVIEAICLSEKTKEVS